MVIIFWRLIPVILFHNDTTGIISSRKVRIVKNIAHDNQQSEDVGKDSLRFDVFRREEI